MGGVPEVQCNAHSLAAIDQAAALLKSIGFTCLTASMKSEACYYVLPGWNGVIRIAAHRFGRDARKSMNAPVAALVTFGKNQGAYSQQVIEQRCYEALGRYFFARVAAQKAPPDEVLPALKAAA